MELKRLFITGLLLSVAFTACEKKEMIIGQPEEGEFSYVFKVASDETKTTFADNHVAWENGDKVASYAKTSKNQSAAVSVSGGDVTINVKSTVALTPGDVVYAYYPYSSSNNAAEASAVTLEIPTKQVSGSADAMPMVALPFTLTGNVEANAATEVGTLQFLNLGSVIKLNIYSSDVSFQGETIESVEFQAGAACAGSFSYDLTTVDASSPAVISGYTGQEVVSTGRSNVGTSSSDGGVYYLVVAPGSYSGSFIIRTNRADYTYVSGKSRDYERAHVKPLNIDLSSVNWVANTSYDTSIDSPREFLAFLAGTSSGDTADYTITADLNMDGYSLTTSASGFGGTLDGGLHTISNLTSSVPMFATNAGTIKDLIIDGSCAFAAVSNIFGALVAEDNGGTYSEVRNRAAVTYTASGNVSSELMIGSLIGKANGATLTSCTNGGAVKIEATGYNHLAVGLGGIVGYAEQTTFDSCVNRGPVTLNADYGDPNNSLNGRSNAGIALGGILGNGYDHGKDKYCTFKSCQNESAGVITLKHTKIENVSGSTSAYIGVGGILGKARGNMKNCKNFAPINVTATTSDRSIQKLQKYCINVGGVAGMARWAISLESCRNDGNITVTYDGRYNDNRNRSTVGGICGWQDYDGTDAVENQADIFAYYCSQRGNITVRGGVLSVGGIFGFSGKQIGNKVYDSCTIDYSGAQGYVGGLVGVVSDNPTYYSIKNSSCAATIVAEDTDSDDKYYNVGGLIGQWGRASSNSENWSCLTDRDNSPCSFTGSVSSTTVSRVGIAVGYIPATSSNQHLTFGSSSYSIEASGTYGKKDLAATAIHAGNVATYAIGASEGATVTMYIISSTPAPANLTLMSFNIREGSNWSSRKAPIVSMINGEAPDIIGLQEVKDLDMWDHMSEDHPWDYLRDHLSAYTGYRYSDKTNAILYKTSTVELSNTGYFWLRDSYSSAGNSWDGYERMVLYATVREKATGRNFFYINTHFPMNNTDGGWAKCTALLESRIAALNTNNYPVILVGDFNCVYGDACWDSIKTKMYNTRYAPGVSVISAENRNLYTYNAFGDSSKDRNKVDHIWVSKSITVDSYVTLTTAVHDYGGYTTNGEKFLSDHYPIIAHIS